MRHHSRLLPARCHPRLLSARRHPRTLPARRRTLLLPWSAATPLPLPSSRARRCRRLPQSATAPPPPPTGPVVPSPVSPHPDLLEAHRILPHGRFPRLSRRPNRCSSRAPPLGAPAVRTPTWPLPRTQRASAPAYFPREVASASAWMDGFRKVSFLPGWSELQIPSGPREPAISASSSPLPLGITSSPNASSAPSDRPQREVRHGGNKTARQCAFLQHIRRKKKQHEVPVDYLIGQAKCNRRSSSAATRQTPSKKDLPLSLLMGPQFVRNQIQPFDPLLFVGVIFKKNWIL
ncbi:protein enabled homolog isoform X6 [Triticum aestivum]|uniref:protein enabled homolog isoform X6 n=1 Tax=Triticum aestivum TaxID=4565 RepID=UPI001D008D9F|nr:protein enabled homolog isoform X6 [Triticum aestivum]